jgi:hypothetical protein
VSLLPQYGHRIAFTLLLFYYNHSFHYLQVCILAGKEYCDEIETSCHFNPIELPSPGFILKSTPTRHSDQAAGAWRNLRTK